MVELSLNHLRGCHAIDDRDNRLKGRRRRRGVRDLEVEETQPLDPMPIHHELRDHRSIRTKEGRVARILAEVAAPLPTFRHSTMITNSIKFSIKSQVLMRTLWFLSSQMHLSEQMITELTSFLSFGYQLLYWCIV